MKLTSITSIIIKFRPQSARSVVSNEHYLLHSDAIGVRMRLRKFERVFAVLIGGLAVDEYNDILIMLETIKNNSKAISYIKSFLQAFISRYC